MAKKIECYVDTSAFIAFLDRSDSYHELFSRLFSAPPKLLTSSLVIAEGHGWFLRRYDAHRAFQFLSFIEELPMLSIEAVGEKEIAAAAHVMRKYSDQNLTLADGVGLSLLQRFKIRSCWSTDRHLGITGIPLIIHE